ncbi:2Fe-2S iron-sulfur cluster-binding protein [Paenibacillus sambharensis]|nr:2Fe-2S iron-sulfur cluster-binding protein [Paenibacillus sambharensis]
MAVTVTFLPERKTVSVHPGTSVLEAARKARILIKTRCGGKAGCLMCKVKDVSGEGLSAQADRERRKLLGTADGTRLSCQAKVVGDAVVEVPEDPLKSAVRKLLEKQQEEEEGLW